MLLTFKNSYTAFWDWFMANQNMIYEFEKGQQRIFHELTLRLERVNKNLTFELSSIREDGKRDFIISTDGIKSAFPAVEMLFRKPPNWKNGTS
jgi:hypothetical protein